MATHNKQLHWTQRAALVRHNLHAACRSGDFHFFKTLQANGFMDGTNHVATLSEELGDDADILLAGLDNLNAGLTYVYQDAFKYVYENLKSHVRDFDTKADKSKLYVDITMQKNTADIAIDKMTSSAIALINQQPVSVQDAAAHVWITGITVISDCIEVSLKQMNEIEQKLDDFIRLEESWNTVKASVVCAVTVLKGVFRLMDTSSPQDNQKTQRSSSIVSASGLMFRRLSSAFVGGPGGGSSDGSRTSSVASAPAPPLGQHSRNNSAVSSATIAMPVYRTPNYKRNSPGCPSSFPLGNEFASHALSPIPPTPAALMDVEPDPFDTTALPVPEMPALPVAVASLSMDSKRFSQVAF